MNIVNIEVPGAGPRNNHQQSTELEGIWQATAYWMGDSGLYLFKEQEFNIVEEVWPTLFFIFRGGHTSTHIQNPASFWDMGFWA